MKKTFKMLGMACLVGAFAFLGSSCKKEKTDTNSVRVILPAMEEVVIDGDRAYIDFTDGNQLKWYKDDQIMLYNLNKDYTKSIRNIYTLYDGEGTTEGDFNGAVMGNDFGSESDGMYAFYPASKVITEQVGPGNRETFNVPAEQYYDADLKMDPTSLVMAAKTGYNGANVLDGSYRMKHIFGFFKLRLTGTQTVTSIEIVDNAFNLSGNVTVTLPGVNADNLQQAVTHLANPDYPETTALQECQAEISAMNYYSEGEGRKITLVCDEVKLSSTPTDFFIPLRPGSMREGFTVKVNYVGGSHTITKYDPNSAGYGYTGNTRIPRYFCTVPNQIRSFSYAIPND